MLEMKDSLDIIRDYRRNDVGRDSSWCAKCACIQYFNHIKWKHQDMSDAKKVQPGIPIPGTKDLRTSDTIFQFKMLLKGAGVVAQWAKLPFKIPLSRRGAWSACGLCFATSLMLMHSGQQQVDAPGTWVPGDHMEDTHGVPGSWLLMLWQASGERASARRYLLLSDTLPFKKLDFLLMCLGCSG